VNASPDLRRERRPSLKDVARLAGVSLATASYALQNHTKIPEGTRERVKEAAETLGYRANATVSRLMAELRSDQGGGSTIAWVNCHPTQDIYRKVPWLRGWLTGAQSRAESLGYGFEEFWLREEGMSAERLREILTARGTTGIFLAPTRSTDGVIPIDISGFPVVSVGGMFSEPVVHQAWTNNHANVVLALEKMREMGYRKIGLFSGLLTRELAVRQFAAAFLEWQEGLLERERSKPLLHEEDTPNAETAFQNWIRTNRFDAVLSTASRPMKWLANMGLRVPQDIGLAHLNLANDVSGWTGIDPLVGEVAAAAIDLLIGQIQRHDTGPPRVPKITLISGVWIEGRTLRWQERVAA